MQATIIKPQETIVMILTNKEVALIISCIEHAGESIFEDKEAKTEALDFVNGIRSTLSIPKGR